MVTGASGPLGIALVRILADLKVSVAAVVQPGSKRISDVPALHGVRIMECDLSTLAQLEEKLPHDFDTFFHLGWAGTDSRETRKDPATHARNILYCLDAVNLSRLLGCRTFIGAGSQSELAKKDGLLPDEGAPSAEESYGIAKYAAGRLSLKLCEEYGIRHCWARIVSIYGPGERPTTGLMYCIHSLLRGEKPSLTRGDQLWDYLFSADGARALYLMALKGRHGAAYSVGSGCTRPLREYFECLRDCIDPALPLGIGEKEYPEGQIMHLCANTLRLEEDTGFVPQVAFEEGIRQTVEWVRKKLERP
jgi:nucleoside-diphosphate-sugar epimerase